MYIVTYRVTLLKEGMSMKKHPAVYLLLILVFSGCKEKPYVNDRNYSYDKINEKKILSQEELDEDLDALSHLIPNAYVVYKKSVKKGFKLKSFIRDVKKNCYKTQDGSYSDISLLTAISKTAVEHFPYEDSHFYLGKNFNWEWVFKQHFVLFTDVYFKKEGDDYFVFSSGNEEIAPGKKYCGKSKNLYKVMTRDGELYRFGILSDENSSSIELKLEDGTINVNVAGRTITAAQSDTSKTAEEGNVLYIKCSDWIFGTTYESDAMTQARKKYDEIKTAALNAGDKDFVILDLRGNPGGDDKFVKEFLYNLYFGNETKLIGPFTNNLKKANQRTITLTSSEIAYSGNRTYILSQAYNPKYEKDLYPPEYKGLDEKKIKEFPVYEGEKKFKGKVIIISNILSASASEQCIAIASLIDKNNLILVGENTHGCISYGGVCSYYLPNSGIAVYLSCVDFSETALYTQNEKWAGETYGFMPDYWATDEMLLETLECLTGNKNLAQIIN